MRAEDLEGRSQRNVQFHGVALMRMERNQKVSGSTITIYVFSVEPRSELSLSCGNAF